MREDVQDRLKGDEVLDAVAKFHETAATIHHIRYAENKFLWIWGWGQLPKLGSLS